MSIKFEFVGESDGKEVLDSLEEGQPVKVHAHEAEPEKIQVKESIMFDMQAEQDPLGRPQDHGAEAG